jgi:DNA-directed RNA polymerase subunit E'/Rpb7
LQSALKETYSFGINFEPKIRQSKVNKVRDIGAKVNFSKSSIFISFSAVIYDTLILFISKMYILKRIKTNK